MTKFLLPVLIVGLLAYPPWICEAADPTSATAYTALRSMGKSLGADTLNRVVEVTGRGGTPQPATWRIVITDGELGGRARVKVAGARVVSQKVSGQASSLKPIRLDRPEPRFERRLRRGGWGGAEVAGAVHRRWIIRCGSATRAASPSGSSNSINEGGHARGRGAAGGARREAACLCQRPDRRPVGFGAAVGERERRSRLGATDAGRTLRGTRRPRRPLTYDTVRTSPSPPSARRGRRPARVPRPPPSNEGGFLLARRTNARPHHGCRRPTRSPGPAHAVDRSDAPHRRDAAAILHRCRRSGSRKYPAGIEWSPPIATCPIRRRGTG